MEKSCALLQKTPSLEECNLTLVLNKSLDDDDEGFRCICFRCHKDNGKNPEQSKKNEVIIRSTKSIVQYLRSQEKLECIEYVDMFWLQQEDNKGSQGLGRDSTCVDMEEVEHLLLPQKFCGRKGDKHL